MLNFFEWVPITLLLALLVITILRILVFFYRRKNRHPCGCLFSLGRGIRIRTLNDGVRASQSFFKTAYLSHFSDFASLKNLSEFCFCLEQQIRMRNCEPYTEVSKETLNPHHLLQRGTAPFDDEEYKRSLFNRIQTECRSHIFD